MPADVKAILAKLSDRLDSLHEVTNGAVAFTDVQLMAMKDKHRGKVKEAIPQEDRDAYDTMTEVFAKLQTARISVAEALELVQKATETTVPGARHKEKPPKREEE